MDTINTGGPAFPVIAENGLGHIADGMSMRDYFAAKALPMFVNSMSPRQAAEEAYIYAGEMIAARGA